MARHGSAQPARVSAPATAAGSERGPLGRPAEAPIIYLAGSAAQAAAIQAAMDEDAAHAQEVNAPPAPAAAVTIIESEQDLGRLLQLAGAADALNAALGLPAMQVVDRRTP
jgi:hypothetical protein